jgi:hypothetical protein
LKEASINTEKMPLYKVKQVVLLSKEASINTEKMPLYKVKQVVLLEKR